MHITHNKQQDVLYVRFNERPFAKNIVLAGGMAVLDIADDGTIIGIEIIDASHQVDSVNSVTLIAAENLADGTPE